VIQPRNPSEYGPDNASKMTPIAILNFRQNLSMLAIPPSLRSYLGQLLTEDCWFTSMWHNRRRHCAIMPL